MSDTAAREPTGADDHHEKKNTSPEHADEVEKHTDDGSENSDTPKKKDKYDRSGPHPIVGLIIFLVLQFLALLLLTVATPLEMFTLDDTWRDQIFPGLAGSDKKLCVTAWGMKEGCRSAKYYNRDFTNNFCSRVRLDFKIVEAFCIMAIAFMAIALITSIFSICQKVGKGSVGALGVFAAMLCLIPWGVLAGMYWQKPCCETYDWHTPQQQKVCVFSPFSNAWNKDVPPFKDMGKYGPGFGLIVASWALQVVGCVFVFLPF